jgi:hypothetical protein
LGDAQKFYAILVKVAERSFWKSWAKNIQRWGLSEAAAALLEAVGPMSLVAAQLLYFSQPLIGPSARSGQWDALANLLEDQDERRSFAAYLREGRCQ